MLNKITEFIKELPYMKTLGYDPFMIFAQCSLETTTYDKQAQKWKSFTCDASKVNNFAGMYNTKDWKGQVVDLRTGDYFIEDDQSVLKPVRPGFKVYPTIIDFFNDYDAYIKGKFPDAYAHRNEYKAYFNGIMHVIERRPATVDYDALLEAIWPSFSSTVTYARDCINKYEILQSEQPDLYMILMAA